MAAMAASVSVARNSFHSVARTAATVAMAAGFESAGDEIDDEIREIFLEEFEDEINNLDGLLAPAAGATR